MNEEGRSWLVSVPDIGSASWSHIAGWAGVLLLSATQNTILRFHNYWSPPLKMFFGEAKY